MSELSKSLSRAGSTALLERVSDPISVLYVDREEYSEIKNREGIHILAGVQFGCERSAVLDDDKSIHQIAIPSIETRKIFALWLSRKPVAYQNHGQLSLAANEDVLIGQIRRDYYHGGIESNVYRCYRDMLAHTEAAGYPHLLRIWNYIPNINSDYKGMESYRRFSQARYGAFEKQYLSMSEILPAATAVGITGDQMLLSFIAGKRPGVFVENPRQVSAYHYPSTYGPRSPSFARATYQRWGQREILFISGTASIFGHESQHPGDLKRQLEETLTNMESVIEHAINQRHLHSSSGLRNLTGIKVYLRDLADYQTVRQILERRFNSDIDMMVLQADICRAELLVEVEAMVGSNLDEIKVVKA